MEVSPELSCQLSRVKSETLHAACLPEQGQIEQQHCSVSALGGATPGACHIKEEPPEDCSDEHPIVEVKTEPYDTAILEGRDHLEHSDDSASEDATASTGYNSSNAQCNTSTAELQTLFTNTVPLTEPNPGDVSPDQRETQEASESLSRTSDHQKYGTNRCTVCFTPCIDVAHFDAHLKTHSANTFTCNMNSAPIHQASHGVNMNTKHHTVEGLYKCGVCTHECVSQASLKYHLLEHACKESVQRHIEAKHQMGYFGSHFNPSTFPWSESGENQRENRDEELHECNFCPATFSCSTSLRHHRQLHAGVQKPYRCDLCAAEFSQGSILRRHRRTHSGEKPYKCALCPAEFSQSGSLPRHMKLHTGVKPHKCQLCPAEFTRLHLLKEHVRTHTEEKPYKCVLCPAGFRHSSSLQHHRKRHTGAKPYKCDVCPAGFGQSTDLRRHQQIHTGEKPHKCDVCPAEFSQSTNLQRHKRTHTDEKPYQCDLCPAAYRDSTNLRRHRQKHTGEKQHKCDLCPAAFIQSTHLRRHQLIHMGEKPHRPDLCPAEFSYAARVGGITS
ncbi:zinc finger protein 883-like [Ornithodoros turicata]|uniref:zinc finger protein 883-like n=1 Tax=Ornithodoros turicata TaxID=34597 RepID=UPI00313A0DA5